jgi:medium-chain acyl-[acyl-carrier-protein] hydrolase
VYRDWAERLAPDAELCPVELPGRGSRFREPPFKSLLDLVDAAARALRPHLDARFALFGHSMGAIIGYELARELERVHGLRPVHLFVSGCPAPKLMNWRPPLHGLPDEEFLNEIRRLNGTPPAVLEHRELMEMMMALLRADLQVVETYKYAEGPPLECPITAFGGVEDSETTEQQIRAWGGHTSASFETVMLPGDHFFVHTAEAALLDNVIRRLRETSDQ